MTDHDLKTTSSKNIHCPGCGSTILSQVALAEGSRFVVKCIKCKQFVKFIVGFNFIQKKLLIDLHQNHIIADEAP